MELNLSPQTANATLFEGEGGAYYAWTSPVLVQEKLGAGKLILQPRGFALPHYADSSKIGYVIQGTCTVGLITPNSSEEKVLIINQGEAIPVPIGIISWWFNGGDSDLTIIFLGETAHSHTPGSINYFLLSGALGLLGGFSNEVVSKIYKLSENEAEKLATSQNNALIFKLDNDIVMPNKSNCDEEKYVITKIREKAIITADDFPLLDKIGLSVNLEKLEANAALGPYYGADGTGAQIVYVTKGSGKVEVVGLNGKQIMSAQVQQGQLFVVPKFFAVVQVAEEQGMEFFSIITSPRPSLGHLAGNLSVWKAISSPVLKASLNLDSTFLQVLKAKIGPNDHKSA